MTGIPIASDDGKPREGSTGSRTLIISAGSKPALAVLNAPCPLPLPPGSVPQPGDPPGELVVTGVRVIAGPARRTRVRPGPGQRPTALHRPQTARHSGPGT